MRIGWPLVTLSLSLSATVQCGDAVAPTDDAAVDAADPDAPTLDADAAALCPPSSPIYFMTDGSAFFSFDPTTFEIVHLPIVCGSSLFENDVPFAVAHDATAWYVDEPNTGDKTFWYPVSLLGSTCPSQEAFTVPTSAGLLSAAYVSNSPGSPDETLYVSRVPSGGGSFLSTLDAKGQLAAVGSLDRAYTLAGTADGRLFGLGHVGTDATSKLVEIARSSGATTTLATPSIAGDLAYARGQLFAFTIVAGSGSGETDVYAFDPKSYAAKKVAHIPYYVSHVATSTCAAP